MPYPSWHLKRTASSRHLSRHHGTSARLGPHPLPVSPWTGEDDLGAQCVSLLPRIRREDLSHVILTCPATLLHESPPCSELCQTAELSRRSLMDDHIEESDHQHTQQDKKKDQGDPCLAVVV
jgi:hypothetical protein